MRINAAKPCPAVDLNSSMSAQCGEGKRRFDQLWQGGHAQTSSSTNTTLAHGVINGGSYGITVDRKGHV